MFRKSLRNNTAWMRISLNSRGQRRTEPLFSFLWHVQEQLPGFTGGPKILNASGDLLSPYPHVCLSNPGHPINSHHMAFPISNRKWNLGPVYRVTLLRLTNDPCQAPVVNADWMPHTFFFFFLAKVVWRVLGSSWATAWGIVCAVIRKVWEQFGSTF